MNIGDKVIAVNTFGTTSLEYYKEYVIVDINEYGNIGLKDPAEGCLLEHYYRPSRLQLAPRYKAGQIYKYNTWQCDERIMIVKLDQNKGYVTVELSSGKEHYPAVKKIEDVFDCNADMFDLVAESLDEYLAANK